MSAFVLRYLGKVDILGHPKDVDVHAKLMIWVVTKTLFSTFAYVDFTKGYCYISFALVRHFMSDHE